MDASGYMKEEPQVEIRINIWVPFSITGPGDNHPILKVKDR